jgi:predicted transcriptional regulator
MKGMDMSKTVTLRLHDNVHKKLRTLAERDHRTLSNFIETATLRYVEQSQFVDEFEMDELQHNEELKTSLKRAQRDMKKQKGRFVE